MRLIRAALLSASILGLCLQPASAFVVQYSWGIAFGNGNSPTYGSNSVTMGPVNGGAACTLTACASGACSTIAAGDVLELILAVNGSAGDPGSISTPTGFTLVSQNVENAMRVATFYKVATGSESCASGFVSTWTNTTPTAVEYAIVDLHYTGGSAPGSAIDASGNNPQNDGTTDMTAPSITPSNSTDLLQSIYTSSCWCNAGGSSVAAGQTKRFDSFAVGGAFAQLLILIGDQTLVASGATGVRQGTDETPSKNHVNFNIAFNQPGGAGGVTPKLPLYVNSIP